MPAVLALLCATAASGSSAKLVKDIEQASTGCATSEIVAGPDVFYFGTSSFCRDGLALWRTDGTVVGTTPVRTFERAPDEIAFLQPIVTIGGTLFFGIGPTDQIGAPMKELWRSDGTDAGTTLLHVFAAPVRIVPQTSAGLALHAVLGDRLVFFTEARNTGEVTPWVTDGSPGGTQAIGGLTEPIGLPTQILVHQGAVHFVAYHRGQPALLRIDATFSGISLLGELGNVGAKDASVDPTVVPGPDGALWFQKTIALGQREVWRSEGTPATTARVLSLPSRAVWALAGDVHYVLEQTRGTARVSRLEPSTGTLTLLHDFAPPALGTNDLVVRARDHGLLYFGYAHKTFAARSLWRSDGTVGGTFRIYDGDVVGPLVAFGGGVGFSPAGDGDRPLWFSDGTVAGTHRLVERAMLGFDHFRSLGDGSTLFVGREDWRAVLYRTDAIADGTTVVQDFPVAVSALAARDGVAVLFNFGTLWRTDGTPDGTFPLLEVGPDTHGSSPHLLTDVAGTVYFVVDHGVDPQVQLWRSDGTRNGTRRVLDWRGPEAPSLLTALGDRLLFSDGRAQLWASDGSSAGTTAIADLGDGDPATRIREIREVGDVAYVALRGARPTQGALWRSEGTGETTKAIAPLAARSLVPWSGALYFAAASSPTTDGVWRSDGTARGTRPLVKFRAQPNGQRPHVGPLLAGDEALWFSVGFPEHTELWRSDGTREGTVLLSFLPGLPSMLNDGIEFDGGLLFSFAPDLAFGRDNLFHADAETGWLTVVTGLAPLTNLGGFTRAGTRVLLKSPDDASAAASFVPQDLWATDGTEQGTVGLLQGALPGAMVAVGDVVYFCAAGWGDGPRIWRTDGTPTGTVPAFERNVACSGSPIRSGDRLFFAGENPRYGLELWSAVLDPP